MLFERRIYHVQPIARPEQGERDQQQDRGFPNFVLHKQEALGRGGEQHHGNDRNDKDENPGGCSIDSMTGFVRETGNKLGINFFDRFKVAVEYNNDISLMNFDEAGVLAKENPSLHVFDSLIRDMGELRTNWKKKFVESWHGKLA